jgi:hypothetical protein
MGKIVMKTVKLGIRGVFVVAAFFFAVLQSAPAQAAIKTDIVFAIDASGSMAGEIAGVRSGFSSFVSGLDAASVDARFAIIVFGGTPELILDFTSDTTAVQNKLNNIMIGANPGVHNNHNVNPEAGLEVIRMAFGGAANNEFANDNIAEDGILNYRPDARKNLILATDEDSDRPAIVANRLAGQTSENPPNPINADWQAEVDAAAQAAINAQAFVNMLINIDDDPTRSQYGDWMQDVSDDDLLNFDAAATLTNLQNAGYGDSLQAQILSAGLIGRTFDVAGANDLTFVENFFATKVEEIITDPGPQLAPEPGSLGILGVGLAGLGFLRRRGRKAA